MKKRYSQLGLLQTSDLLLFILDKSPLLRNLEKINHHDSEELSARQAAYFFEIRFLPLAFSLIRDIFIMECVDDLEEWEMVKKGRNAIYETVRQEKQEPPVA